MSTPSGETATRYSDLDIKDYAWWSIRSRDEQFRTFDPERIGVAIAKAFQAADDNDDDLSPERLKLCATVTKDICEALTARKPEGGSFYIEEVQDQAELGLMRAGEHEAARRFVLYREERRRLRHSPDDMPESEGMDGLLDSLADPLLKQSMDRFVMFPIQHDNLWDAFKEHLALMWTAEEIDLSKDVQDWKKLNADEQHFIKHVLAFFAASDGIVNENLAIRFYNDVTAAEARSFYSMQMLIETIHSETYSLLIDTYISNELEKNELLHAAETLPIVQKKPNGP